MMAVAYGFQGLKKGRGKRDEWVYSLADFADKADLEPFCVNLRDLRETSYPNPNSHTHSSPVTCHQSPFPRPFPQILLNHPMHQVNHRGQQYGKGYLIQVLYHPNPDDLFQ